ncbi:MAG: outer membrane protein assembly factor BamC [Thiomicrospira sp.]|uniref:outer membrane protein assembly factor BamC n=1 Tax=Thiomicrospira sp. TaxID=935 RepID=UPI001A08D631|nr:outer membrane protein assembly factor BamC [Thiomicrospira sp.]MBE0493724.1 outer membrane protein assembly factor BamC [Thiomicrospira sp.]
MALLKLVGLSALVVTLAGCSSLSNIYNGEDDHRVNEAELAKKLEMPPNFIEPRGVNPLLTQTVASVDLSEVETIPTYQVEQVKLQSNLVERWLEFDEVDVKQVWLGLRQFVKQQGFKIAEERLDLGLIKTEYLARTEQAPVEQELGALSRMLNSWRPELASGIYDRFSIQVIDEPASNKVKVTIRHHMMQADSSGNATDWALRPYDTMMESLALYRAMVFFGATQLQALAEIETTAYYQEILEGEELAGLVLAASRSQAWDYLQAMVYRAQWQVTTTRPALYEIWVNTPESTPSSKGFFGRLFSGRDLPQVVRLKLTPYESDTEQTLLSLNVEEGVAPLNPEQRRHILTALGLLAK